MGQEIVSKVVLTIVGFVVTGILGYLIALIKEQKKKEQEKKKKEEEERNALKCLLRSAITKIYYKYTDLGYIPRFEKENVSYLYTQYKAMNGNSYVDEAYPEIMKLPITKEK